MLVIALVILVAISGFSGASEECETPVLHLCHIDDYDFVPPETKEALQTFCENGKKLLECVIGFRAKCGTSSNYFRNLGEIVHKINVVCTENHIFYKDVSENIECIASAFTSKSFACPESVTNGMENVFIEEAITSELQSGCSSALFFMSCLVANIRRLCGEVPARATLDAIYMFRLPVQCEPVISDKLPAIVHAIELIEQEENKLKYAFERGFFLSSEVCETPVHHHCHIDDYNFDPPASKEALQLFCENGKEILECVIAFGTKCGASSSDLTNLHDIESNLNYMCNETSTLYRDISQNIECIGSAFTSTSFACPESVTKSMEKVITERGITSRLQDESRCSSALFFMSCLVATTRQLCGEFPAAVTLVVILSLRFPAQCDPEIGDALPAIVREIEIIRREEN